MKNRDYSWLLYVIVIAIAVLASCCGTTPQPVSQDAPSLAGVSIADSIQFELKAEFVTELVFVGEIPATNDTVCAYIVDTTMYIQQFVANKEPFHKYQNRMFRFIWNY